MILKKYFFSASRIVFSILIVQLVFSSCEEVIDIDVDELDNKIVIEASINDVPGQGKIILSLTENAFKQGGNTTVAGAKITLTDEDGNSFDANESPAGKYSFPPIQGVHGKTYFLNVSVNGINYSASSKLNEPMTIDSIKFEKTTTYVIWGIQYGYYKMKMYITNKPGVDEYCIIKISNSDGSNKYMIVYQDKYAGNNQIILTNGSRYYQKNESLNIEILTIDKASYDFFFHLNELKGNSGIDVPDLFNVSTYNPKSNLSNGALGCFYAYSYKKYNVVVK